MMIGLAWWVGGVVVGASITLLWSALSYDRNRTRDFQRELWLVRDHARDAREAARRRDDTHGHHAAQCVVNAADLLLERTSPETKTLAENVVHLETYND